MGRILKRRPSPAMIVAVIALIAALTGTAFAGGFLSKKKFNQSAVKGPITYVQTSAVIPPTATTALNVAAACPAGSRVIGGGIRVSNRSVAFIFDSYPTSTGWAGSVFNSGNLNHTAVTVAICAYSNSATGTLPAN